MFKPKWLAIVGAAVLIASAIFPFVPTPSGAAGFATPPQPQYNHARPPIYYAQVARPANRGKSGPAPGAVSAPYSPSEIQSAYNFGSFANGSGQAIAIIDAYGDPNLTSDVAAFDSQFGLSSGSIKIYYPDGSPRGNNSGWALETALDVEWAHANAPGATIDVIIAPDSSFQSLLDCIKFASGQYAGISGTPALTQPTAAISMSWGAPETSISSDMRNAYEATFSATVDNHIILLSSSGDNGATDGTSQLTTDYPSSSQYVIGVGGTTLTLNSSGGYGGETAWNDSGGGYSSLFSEPDYQSNAGINISGRGVPDVAFDGDPNTGVYVCSNGNWYQVGGTSVGAPNWAAIEADNAAANSGHALNDSYLYDTVYTSSNYSSEMHDVTGGYNGGYNAGTGWDPVTGLGSPDVSSLINPPALSPDFSVNVTPTDASVKQGSSAPYTVTVTSLNEFTGTVDLSVSDLPSGATGNFSSSSLDISSNSSSSSTLTITTNANTLDAGSYTFTITGTSSKNTSLSHSINATLTVTSSSNATKVSVNNIIYSLSGGKHHNQNLSITVSLIDNLNNPVPNASVSITTDLNGSPYASWTGTTGTNGTVTFTISHAPKGTYTTTVTGVSAGGLTWDGKTPSNSFTK